MPAPAEFALSLADIIRLIKMSKTITLYVAVVDDDENFCRSLGRLLRAAGMHPVMYASAEEFLADKKHPRFDCLVLDVHLGEMSGIELGQRLVAESRHAPFICITAHEDPERAHGPKPRVAPRSSERPIPVPPCSTRSAAWRAELLAVVAVPADPYSAYREAIASVTDTRSVTMSAEQEK